MSSEIGAVERQVSEVRRRRNLFAAQQVVYVPVAIAGALVALLIVLAFVVPSRSFVAAVWAAIVVFAFGIVRAIRRLRGHWLGADAPLAIDRSAALEERLVTLTALSSKRIESRLWGHLVADNLRLLGRWTPQALTPRRVPRSLWPALASAGGIAALVVLALIGGDADGGFFPRPGSHPTGSEPNDGEFPPGSEAVATTGGTLVDLSQLLAALPERLREEILRRARRAPPGTEPPPGSRPAGRSKSRGSAGGGAGPEPGEEKDRTKIARDGAGSSKTGDAKSPGTKLARRERPQSPDGTTPQAPPPAKGDGLKVLGKRPKGQEAGGTSGGGPGAGSGSDAGSLYGPRDGEGRPNGIFALDLDAERGDGGEEGDGESGPRPASPLASEQRIDDAVRRAQVPADYEGIVQRLFNRGDAAAETDAREAR